MTITIRKALLYTLVIPAALAVYGTLLGAGAIAGFYLGFKLLTL